MAQVEDSGAPTAPTDPGIGAADAPPRPPASERPPPRKSDRPSARPGGPTSLVGQLLSGRYRVIRLIGEGAMGAVYEAEHVHMRKRMAIKVLHAEMTRLPEIVERFEREAMAAGNIDHPNVAAASDFGKLDDGSFFLVLEYVVGRSLRDALTTGRFELGRALHVTRQIANAVGRAHALNIVHRDLKPENVMLVERAADADFVKVLDFGIAKVPVGELSGSAPTPSGAPALTRLGMVFGTPDYMSPEQAMGQEVDARADLYALGVLAYEMLTGARPFDHANAATLLTMHITAPVPPMATIAPDAAVPAEVEAIVTRLLAKDPADRFQTATELAVALTAIMGELAARGRIDVALVDRAGASGPMSVRAFTASNARLSVASTPGGEIGPVARTLALLVVDRLRPYAVLARRHLARVPRNAWFGAGGVLLLLLLVRAVAGGHGATPASSAASGAAARPAPPPLDRGLASDVSEAEALLEKSDYAGAIAELTPLAAAHPDASVVHHDLERARMGAGDVKGALLEAKAWLQGDVTTGRDPKFEEDVRSAAIGTSDPDDAFALLETSMGAVGADILYDLGYGPARTSATERARAALADPNVRRNASPALAVTLDLRGAGSCDGKKKVLERARDAGDARTLTLLEGYKATSGCGWTGRKDCWACMHRGGALAAAIEGLQARLAKP